MIYSRNANRYPLSAKFDAFSNAGDRNAHRHEEINYAKYRGDDEASINNVEDTDHGGEDTDHDGEDTDHDGEVSGNIAGSPGDDAKGTGIDGEIAGNSAGITGTDSEGTGVDGEGTGNDAQDPGNGRQTGFWHRQRFRSDEIDAER